MKIDEGLRVSNDDSTDQDPEEITRSNEIFREKRAAYKEYVTFLDSDSEHAYLRLSFQEFMHMGDVDEAEFGPEDSLDTIYREFMDLPYPKKECQKLCLFKSNRFVLVQRKKQQRLEKDDVAKKGVDSRSKQAQCFTGEKGETSGGDQVTDPKPLW